MYTYSAGSPGTFSGPRPIDILGPGYGQTTAATQPATGGGWSDAINAAITGVASIYQISMQQKLMKQQQHAAEREAARQAELAKTQALYLASQSIKPAQGSHVTVAVPPGHARRGLAGMGMVAVLAGGGVLAWMLMRKRR